MIASTIRFRCGEIDAAIRGIGYTIFMIADERDMPRSYDLPEKRPLITTAMVLTVGVLLAASIGLSVVVWALYKIAVNPGS